MLKKLEIEAKERYLQALITSGVDKKVHIDYAIENYEYCKKEVCRKFGISFVLLLSKISKHSILTH